MITQLAALLSLVAALPPSWPGSEDPSVAAPAGHAAALVDIPEERLMHAPPPVDRELSKKELWLADKGRRHDVHLADKELFNRRGSARRRQVASGPAPATRLLPLTTLFNLRTRETLAILPGLPPEERFHSFLRDHHTNQATQMDARLVDVLCRVARRFSAERVDVVSGYRSPKYNLMLRKKGREVARQSQHTEGNAVDFRVRGVPTRRLLQFVRSLRIGGVGYYPHSQFVHSDTGRIRFWRGS